MNRPSQLPSTRPGSDKVGDFLGIGGGAAAGGIAGGALGNRPTTLPGKIPGVGNGGGLGDRPTTLPGKIPGLGNGGGLGDRPGAGSGIGSGNRPAQRPQDRPDWSERSKDRNENWNQRVDNRQESWKQRDEGRQQRRDDFQNNREDRWDNINNNREDRQDWRDQNREDWQDHREDMWDYRFDRADEIWDNCGDFHDNCFDDHWWGGCGWGYGYCHYPVNPWWWWAPVTVAAVNSFVYASAPPPQPVYIDYGMTVVREKEIVYVDNKPVPAEVYDAPIKALATNVEPQPPPLPPEEEGKPAEWLPLGVFALAQEEKGDPVMFFQISVSRDGKISGGYESTLTGDKKPVSGKVDKQSQNVAWRIGDNIETVFATTLANLTLDVSTVAVYFGSDRVQEWLLVRMPEPPPADAKPKAPEINREIPPATPIPVKK